MARDFADKDTAGGKKDMFYNCSQSEMIRTLVDAGLNAIQNERQRNPTKQLV